MGQKLGHKIYVNEQKTVYSFCRCSISQFAMARCCDLAMARMDKTKGGKGGVIVNISSAAGRLIGPYSFEQETVI